MNTIVDLKYQMQNKEIYICQDGWLLYDKWVASQEKQEKEKYRIEFLAHRNACNLCTKAKEEE